MRSLHLKQAATAGLLLAVPLGVTACSSGTSHSVSSPSSPTTSAAPAPATSTPPSATETGKPSKAEVADGMRSYLVSKGVPRSLVDGVTKCVADKGYSQFSEATLRALKDGKVSELNPLDAGTLTTVTTNCLASGPVPTAG